MGANLAIELAGANCGAMGAVMCGSCAKLCCPYSSTTHDSAMLYSGSTSVFTLVLCFTDLMHC